MYTRIRKASMVQCVAFSNLTAISADWFYNELSLVKQALECNDGVVTYLCDEFVTLEGGVYIE